MAKHFGSVSLAAKVSMDLKGCLDPKLTCSAKADVYTCCINPDGDLLAASLIDGTALLFEMQTGSVVYKLPSPSSEQLPATSISFRPQPLNKEESGSALHNVALIAYSSGHVQQWHPATGKVLSVSHEKRQTLVACYSPDSTAYATSGSDHKIIVYDTTTNEVLSTLEPSTSLSVMDGHMNRVFALQYHPYEPHLLISAGWDDTVQFWDTRVNNSIRKISGPHVCGNGLDIEPNTLNILTGSWRQHNPLELWDFNSGELITTSSCCNSTKLYSTCWLEQGYSLVGGSMKHTALVIDLQNDAIVGDMTGMLSAGVYDVSYNTKTKYAAIATGDKIHLCHLSLPKRSSPFLTQHY